MPIFGKLGLIEMDPLLGISLRSFSISLILLVVLMSTGQLGGLSKLDVRSGALIFAKGVFAGLLGHFAYYYALKVGEVSRVVLLARAAPVITIIISLMFLVRRLL